MVRLHRFFNALAFGALRIPVPGGHLIVAPNPLVSSTASFRAVQQAGFEMRGEIIRQVWGVRPRGAGPCLAIPARSALPSTA
ncbi:MAG: hypothetical protein OXH99_10395 [Bryobacterales bacterium]|nr:hypothetical protein [Bryobacterales bacterium]